MSTVVSQQAGLLARVGVPALVVGAGGMVFTVGALALSTTLADAWGEGGRMSTGWDFALKLTPPMLIACVAIWRFYLQVMKAGASVPESSYGSGYGSGDHYYSYSDGGVRSRTAGGSSFDHHAGLYPQERILLYLIMEIGICNDVPIVE